MTGKLREYYCHHCGVRFYTSVLNLLTDQEFFDFLANNYIFCATCMVEHQHQIARYSHKTSQNSYSIPKPY